MLPELPPEHASCYKSLLGIYRWMIELGRVNIVLSILSLHMALPYQGHLVAAHHIMFYLLLHHNSCLCMDPTYLAIDGTQFSICNCSEFYSDAEEPIPPMHLRQ